MAPEDLALGIVGEEKEVAFEDAEAGEAVEAGGDQGLAQALFAMFPGHGQVMQAAAPPIVTAQDRPDDPVCVARDETQARIAREITGDIRFGIGLAQAEALDLLPEA